mmetsp:Transcript_27937/g.71931  ORF Transcript_27937/g.71931 Transcript_27937/m.71931 type:complete len:218 (-) Transcript_27937:844-1497(-)
MDRGLGSCVTPPQLRVFSLRLPTTACCKHVCTGGTQCATIRAPDCCFALGSEQFGGVQEDRLNVLSPPCVADEHITIRGLDHCWVGKLHHPATRILQGQRPLPGDTVVVGQSDCQHATPGQAALEAVVVHEQDPAVLEGHSIQARVRAWDVCQCGIAPPVPVLVALGQGHVALAAANHHAQFALRVEEHCRLNDLPVHLDGANAAPGAPAVLTLLHP